MNKSTIKIANLLLANTKLIIYGLLGMVIGTLLSLLSPLLMRYLVDVALFQNSQSILLFTIMGLIILPVLSTLLVSITTQVNIKIGGLITDQLRAALFNRIATFSPRTMNKFKPGELVGRLTRSCGEIGEVFIQNELLPGINNALMAIGIAIFMYFLSWQLALLSFLMIPIVFIVAQILGKKSEQKTKRLLYLLTKADGYFNEVIHGMKTVQIFGREEKEKNYVKSWIKEHRKLRNETDYIRVWYSQILNNFEQSLGTGIILAFGAWQIINNNLTIGSLLAFTVYIPLLYSSIEAIQRAFVGYKMVQPAKLYVQEVLDTDEFLDGNIELINSKIIEGNITFDNVFFEYEDGRGKLKNVSFKIAKGEIIGIVGPTGGGKTTILDLIMKFSTANRGEIMLDNTYIKQIPYSILREYVTVVDQNPTLWDDTIYNNLLYAKEDATWEEIRKATQIAQIDDFIESLPEGYDTMVGERGIRLSGGEKQRLAIARAILRNSKIVLFDEPTSALDANTETSLSQELYKWFNGRTVIIVAHRLSTIKDANRILVLENGSIIESGTHDQLMEFKGFYSELYLKQFKQSN
ncbi:ABC transporter ATP-binding protein [Paenibacillus donghaensis]|uniref:ABC transporter ATP-binding protein n=1 Tax=Paenibacillus donghaensis TaxID=414771 RepID=UPI001883F9A1|nr:ABC transporter ATP-binding protein [Paenibacillus donghaensis]MBE9914427.1 ABC transporter ATP-binding protein [Paenibacillus donghaensis]